MACALTIAVSGRQESATIKIVSPDRDTDVSGSTKLEVSIQPESAIPTVKSIMFYVDGVLACTIERKPFVCWHDPGDAVKKRFVRVVATLADDSQLKANLYTHD